MASDSPRQAVDKATAARGSSRRYCLHEFATGGKRALLIVDEAQNLPPRAVEELRMLSNFQIGEPVAAAELPGRPARAARRCCRVRRCSSCSQRVIASYHLGPMDADGDAATSSIACDTSAGTEIRRSTTVLRPDPPLTGGIPRRINGLCDRLMLAGFLGEKHVLEPADVQCIAREIRDEMGPDGSLAPPPGSRVVPRARPRPMPSTAAWEAHFRHLEERIDRLDRTVGAAVDLLHRLLHPDKATLKPGSPVTR